MTLISFWHDELQNRTLYTAEFSHNGNFKRMNNISVRGILTESELTDHVQFVFQKWVEFIGG